MKAAKDKVQQIENIMRALGSFLCGSKTELSALGFENEEGEELHETVTTKLASLRASIRSLDQLKERDRFGRDPSVATERAVYNREIALSETYLESTLLPLIKNYGRKLKDSPKSTLLAER